MGETASSWLALRSFIANECGITLAEDQRYLMQARLGAVAKLLNYPNVDDYVLEACRPGAAREVTMPLIDAMTTHETSFFRDSAFWKALVEVVVPKLGYLEHGNTKPLRVWCAACSTGQEAYSLSMMLSENLPSVAERLSIVATDVSQAVLDVGRKATYPIFEVNRGINAHRLLKHFERDGGAFRVKDLHRNRVRWQTQNVLTGWPPAEAFDLVLARNVLIYFAEASRATVVTKLRAALRPGGLIGVGASERLASTPVAPGWFNR